MHHIFPCFNQPEIRARFDLTIHHHAPYNAMSNMPVRKSLINDSLPSAIANVYLKGCGESGACDSREIYRTEFDVSEEMAVSSFAFSITTNKMCDAPGKRTNVHAPVRLSSIIIVYKNSISLMQAKAPKSLCDWPQAFGDRSLKFSEDYFGQTYRLPAIDLHSFDGLTSDSVNSWGLLRIRSVCCPFNWRIESNL